MYDVSKWYWYVGDDETQVWSSRLAAMVPAADPEFVEWKQHEAPSRAATMEDLRIVLAEQYPPGTLETYTAHKRWQKEQAGITLSAGWPIKTDDRSQAKITGVYAAIQVNPAAVTPWAAADGSVHDVSQAEITAMNTDLLTHINNCFSISADVLVQIAAGTITTREQIDAAFDAPMTQARKDWLKK
jgi:hypothetical protein